MTSIERNVTTTNETVIKGYDAIRASSDTDMKISYVLKKLGIGAGIKGYGYIKRAVHMVMENPEYTVLVTKWLYPDIAKEFDTSNTAVERLIRRAIQCIDCDDNIKITFLGYAKKTYTNKEFIIAIAELMGFNA